VPFGVNLGIKIENLSVFKFIRPVTGQLGGAAVENQDGPVGTADENGIPGAVENDAVPLLAFP
jgi:hypothetical protein